MVRRSSATVGGVLIGLLLGVLGTVLIPTAAQAHVERPSYWPDPRPDCTISPCAGGQVPTARSLESALDARAPGQTRVVCQDDSLQRLKASIAKARLDGYYDRPTDHHTLSDKQADALLKVNRSLLSRCAYHEIQAAVTASGNNDRVVVMPGLYTEPTSRSMPTFDPACEQYKTTSDGGDPGALSHDYQLHCPNDANLVAVIGRGSDTAPVPAPPLENRHGIPNPGPCIRCNLQLEGSGVNADDVIVEAGDPAAGNGGPSGVGHAKDVGIFVDRADGFVLRNLTVRHAREHDIYILETDGYLFDRFKTFYASGYGVLTFVEDHGMIQNCEAAGNGDSGIYPGSGADSTDHRYEPFYPTYRFSQTIRWCDSHHNTAGISGTDSHGTLLTQNNFYDNALGITTDVFTAPGHPGYPQHGNVIRDNNFYDNNFNPFVAGSEVDPFIPAPVGTGMWLAGGNANSVEGNRFWDNWRRGVMVFAVPDATVCGPPPLGSETPVPGCDPLMVSTSFDNRLFGNLMGVDPAGQPDPNGVDFWWDSFPGNTGNCWWNNQAAPGRTVTTSPPLLPSCAGGTLPFLSVGTGDVINEGELAACLAGFTVSGYPNGNGVICDWTTTPQEPTGGSPLPQPLASVQDEAFAEICQANLASRLCAPFRTILTELVGSVISAVEDATSPVAGATPVATQGRLSSFTCSWWRQADADHRLGMVQRIREFATGRVDGDGVARYGYGAGMTDARAALLFEDRCTTFQAGSYALYKLYGAAAPFAAYAGG